MQKFVNTDFVNRKNCSVALTTGEWMNGIHDLFKDNRDFQVEERGSLKSSPNIELELELELESLQESFSVTTVQH